MRYELIVAWMDALIDTYHLFLSQRVHCGADE